MRDPSPQIKVNYPTSGLHSHIQFMCACIHTHAHTKGMKCKSICTILVIASYTDDFVWPSQGRRVGKAGTSDDILRKADNRDQGWFYVKEGSLGMEWSALPLQRPAERPGNPVEWHWESRCFKTCKLKPVSLDFSSCSLDKMQPFIIKWM